jgi:aspartyl-tRNA(Asn)/glutamyl-tRNA(Gln) amidotransferase subunit A
MTISEFGRALRAREVTSVAVTQACLARIRERNDELRAFTLILEHDALEQAREADREIANGHDRGPLHGVPISIKDLIDVRGTVTSAASAVRADAPPAADDAPAVAHLRAAGAVFVGKTNLHEFALGTTSEDTVFGAVRNPIDTTRSAGGSSGGSAVSVVTGMALASVGTDTGGSIRIPAAACGIVGLKPSYGEVAADGVIPLSPRLDHVGPLAQTVADAWVVLRVLSGDMHPQALSPRGAHQARLKVLRRYFCDVLDDDVRARFDAAIRAFRNAGMGVSDHEFRHAQVVSQVYLKIAPREAFLGHQQTLDASPEKYSPAVRQRLELGRAVSHGDFLTALNVQADLRDEIDRMLSNCDALVLPSMPIPAPPLGRDTTVIGDESYPTRSLTLRETQLFNLTGHPAISIPCGNTRDGLPVGLQLVGHHGRTDALVRVALTCEGLLK